MEAVPPNTGGARSWRLATLYLRAANEQHALAQTMREIGELLVEDAGEGTDRLLGRVAARRTEREAGPASEPASPASSPAPAPRRSTARERALDAFAATGGTAREVATAADVPISSVSVYLSEGRKAGDPRVTAGEAKRAARRPAAKPARSITPVFEPERRLIPAARPTATAPVVPALPEPPAAPAPPAPIPPPELPPARVELDPDRIMVVDPEAAVVHGPGGSWKVAVPVARAMARLADGGLYGHDVIARAAGFDPRASLREAVVLWRKVLDRIGLRLIEVPHIGIRVERIG